MHTLISCDINSKEEDLVHFCSDPFNLRLWTIHRKLYSIDDKCFEATMDDEVVVFTEIQTSIEEIPAGHRIRFSWTRSGKQIKFFDFEFKNTTALNTQITVHIPGEPPAEKAKQIKHLLGIEFRLLENVMNKVAPKITIDEALFMEHYQQKN